MDGPVSAETRTRRDTCPHPTSNSFWTRMPKVLWHTYNPTPQNTRKGSLVNAVCTLPFVHCTYSRRSWKGPHWTEEAEQFLFVHVQDAMCHFSVLVFIYVFFYYLSLRLYFCIHKGKLGNKDTAAVKFWYIWWNGIIYSITAWHYGGFLL